MFIQITQHTNLLVFWPLYSITIDEVVSLFNPWKEFAIGGYARIYFGSPSACLEAELSLCRFSVKLTLYYLSLF